MVEYKFSLVDSIDIISSNKASVLQVLNGLGICEPFSSAVDSCKDELFCMGIDVVTQRSSTCTKKPPVSKHDTFILVALCRLKHYKDS